MNYGQVNHDVMRVFRMLDPKPKELLQPHRRFVREGPILQWNASEKRHKPKFFFLFNDCMLICKKEGQKKYWLKVFISLNPGIKISNVENSSYHIPNVEFRLYAPKKSFIFFAASQQVKEMWIQDIQAAINRGQKGGRAVENPNKDTYSPNQAAAVSSRPPRVETVQAAASPVTYVSDDDDEEEAPSAGQVEENFISTLDGLWVSDPQQGQLPQGGSSGWEPDFGGASAQHSNTFSQPQQPASQGDWATFGNVPQQSASTQQAPQARSTLGGPRVMDVSTMTSSEFNKFADRGFATETLSETKQAPPPAHSSVGYGQPAGFGYPPPSNGASSAFQSTSVAPKPSNYGAGSMQQGVVAAPSTVGGMNNNRGGLNSNMGGMGAAPIGGMNNNMGGMGYSSVGGMNNMGGMGAAPMGGMNNNMGGMGMNNNMGGMGAPMGGMNNNMGMSAYNMGGMNNMGMNGGMNGGMGTQQYNSSGMTPNYNAPMNSGGSYAAAPQKKQEPDPFASLINF